MYLFAFILRQFHTTSSLNTDITATFTIERSMPYSHLRRIKTALLPGGRAPAPPSRAIPPPPRRHRRLQSFTLPAPRILPPDMCLNPESELRIHLLKHLRPLESCSLATVSALVLRRRHHDSLHCSLNVILKHTTNAPELSSGYKLWCGNHAA